jgi:hypothetical protein
LDSITFSCQPVWRYARLISAAPVQEGKKTPNRDPEGLIMNIKLFAVLLGIVRALIGLLPILGFDRMTAWAGFPREQATPTTRLFARLFGNRDLGLAFLVFATLGNPLLLSFALFFNAAHDALDACAAAVPLVKKQGINRSATIFLCFSLVGVVVFALAGWLAR